MPKDKPLLIYQYIADPDHFECIAPKSRKDEKFCDRFYECKPMGKGWKPFAVRRDSKMKVGDFPSLYGFLPVFSQRAWESLRSLIENAVEALPFKHPSGDAYYAINVLDVVDALDLKKSQPVFYATGQVMRVKEHWFKERLVKGKHMFKVPETSGTEVFVSVQFKSVVEEAKLKGLRFAQVYPPLPLKTRIQNIRKLGLP
jgi:hypothetical protein